MCSQSIIRCCHYLLLYYMYCDQRPTYRIQSLSGQESAVSGPYLMRYKDPGQEDNHRQDPILMSLKHCLLVVRELLNIDSLSATT